jgi:DNA polymerase-3 subunit gamma/tau
VEKRQHAPLARKYRPQRFEELAGQEAVSRTLQNAVGSRRTAHAYLLFGPKGSGKTTTARILAKALNCKDGPTPTPCGACPACLEIAAGNCIDVLELDAASNTQVDKIREMIIESVSLGPSRDRRKIYIIDEVHMLSGSSFNALLKTLEEPPDHAVFILATTEFAKIPATIVSRCQRFRFRPLGHEIIADQLRRVACAERIEAEPEALALLAQAGGGSLRDSLGLLDQAVSFADGKVTREKVAGILGLLPEEILLGTVRALVGRDAKALSARIDQTVAEGYDPSQLLRDLRGRLNELHLAALGVRPKPSGDWGELAAAGTPETFSFLIRCVNRTLEDLRFSDAPAISFELGLFGMIEAAYDLGSWVSRLEALEKRLSGASGAPEPAARTTPEPEPPRTKPPLSHKLPLPDAWKAFLEKLQGDKPVLAAALSAADAGPGPGGSWRIAFGNGFNLDRAKKEQASLEAALSEEAGQSVRLELALSEAPRKAACEEGWVDASSDEEEPQDPGVRKVLGVFPGKVRQARKK